MYYLALISIQGELLSSLANASRSLVVAASLSQKPSSSEMQALTSPITSLLTDVHDTSKEHRRNSSASSGVSIAQLVKLGAVVGLALSWVVEVLLDFPARLHTSVTILI